jgi:hypothetical protein
VVPPRNRSTVLGTVTDNNKITTRCERLIYIVLYLVRTSIPLRRIGLFGHCVYVCAHTTIMIIILKQAQLFPYCINDNNIIVVVDQHRHYYYYCDAIAIIINTRPRQGLA